MATYVNYWDESSPFHVYRKVKMCLPHPISGEPCVYWCVMQRAWHKFLCLVKSDIAAKIPGAGGRGALYKLLTSYTTPMSYADRVIMQSMFRQAFTNALALSATDMNNLIRIDGPIGVIAGYDLLWSIGTIHRPPPSEWPGHNLIGAALMGARDQLRMKKNN